MSSDKDSSRSDGESDDSEESQKGTMQSVSSTYKVFGELAASDGAGVLGHNRATSGDAPGVVGKTDSSEGYGLYTPDDAFIGGVIDSLLTSFTVETAENIVMGHPENSADDFAATIAGGGNPGKPNMVLDDGGTISGGENNEAGLFSTVGGGSGNSAGLGVGSSVGGGFATVGGGENNTAGGRRTTVGGGENNTAIFEGSTVGGGTDNTARNDGSTVGGGQKNTAGDNGDTGSIGHTVGGGTDNTASGSSSTVGGGYQNTASGDYATVPGGGDNLADGGHSFAAGRKAEAQHAGAFVVGDSTPTSVSSQQPDEARLQMPTAIEGRITAESRSIEKSGTSVYQSTPQTVDATSIEQVNFEASNFDDWNAYDYSNDQFDVPADGRYQVSLAVMIGASVPSRAMLFVNDTLRASQVVEEVAVAGVAQVGSQPSITKTFDLQQGETIVPAIEIFTTDEQKETVSREDATYMTIDKVA